MISPRQERRGVTKKRPIFFQSGGRKEITNLSKAAWQDIAWNLAARCTNAGGVDETQDLLVEEAIVTCGYRKRGGDHASEGDA